MWPTWLIWFVWSSAFFLRGFWVLNLMSYQDSGYCFQSTNGCCQASGKEDPAPRGQKTSSESSWQGQSLDVPIQPSRPWLKTWGKPDQRLTRSTQSVALRILQLPGYTSHLCFFDIIYIYIISYHIYIYQKILYIYIWCMVCPKISCYMFDSPAAKMFLTRRIHPNRITFQMSNSLSTYLAP